MSHVLCRWRVKCAPNPRARDPDHVVLSGPALEDPPLSGSDTSVKLFSYVICHT
jgi:hypothetical protein